MIEELQVKRISKYFDYLPPLLQKEVIEDILLDVKGAVEFLEGKGTDE